MLCDAGSLRIALPQSLISDVVVEVLEEQSTARLVALRTVDRSWVRVVTGFATTRSEP